MAAPDPAQPCRRRTSRIHSRTTSAEERGDADELPPSKQLSVIRKLNFSHASAYASAQRYGSKMARLTARATGAAIAFVACEKATLAVTGASLHTITSAFGAPIALASLLGACAIACFILCAAPPRTRPVAGATSGKHPGALSMAAPPIEHPYYAAIDTARQRFLRGEMHAAGGDAAARQSYQAVADALAAEREDRVRAKRWRSHEARRWRLAPARFGSGAEAEFEYDLFDWSVAERLLSIARVSLAAAKHAADSQPNVRTPHTTTPLAAGQTAIAVQCPPLAYNNELARRAALCCGCDFYFSIADFDDALIDGELVLKPTDPNVYSENDQPFTLSLASGMINLPTSWHTAATELATVTETIEELATMATDANAATPRKAAEAEEELTEETEQTGPFALLRKHSPSSVIG